MRTKRRLSALLEVAREAKTVADIGADHGYLTKMLLESRKAKSVIATDISAASLEKTRLLAKRHDFLERIELRVGNGLEPIKRGEADLAIIAGMGGQEIAAILKTAREKQIFEFILQPVQNAYELRCFLSQNGFKIEKDFMVKDQGKFYDIMAVSLKGDLYELTYAELLFGKDNLEKPSKDFLEYLKHYILKREEILKGSKASEKIKKELEWSKKVKDIISKGEKLCRK